MGQVITVAQQKGGSGKTTLVANLAVALVQGGRSVALLDTDPQGSLGRWFMARMEAGDPGMEFSTASAWGVGYEMKKLSRAYDVVLVDTPPKVDSDLRPALRESDIVLVPVATSAVDVWALESILDLTTRVGVPAMVVLNRYKSGTRVAEEVASLLGDHDVRRADAVWGNRVVYAEALGQGKGVLEKGRGAWTEEVEALRDEVMAAL